MKREEFEELRKEKFIKSPVVSDSMFPLIKEGDKITIQTEFGDLKKFDIVVIYLHGKLVCHYLWRMNRIVQPIVLQTRNMRGEVDVPVPLTDCLGKVVSHRMSFWTKLRLLIS